VYFSCAPVVEVRGQTVTCAAAVDANAIATHVKIDLTINERTVRTPQIDSLHAKEIQTIPICCTGIEQATIYSAGKLGSAASTDVKLA
jgi:hypothetical protein